MPAAPRAASVWPSEAHCPAPARRTGIRPARPRTKSPEVTDLTFGWQKKLRKTDEFSSVFRFRCTWRGRKLDVSAGPNTLGFGRLGLIVPKRLIPGAVGRNRVKRLLRECFRQRQADLVGLDIIVRLKGPATDIASDEMVLRDDFLAGIAACRDCVNSRRPHSIDTD